MQPQTETDEHGQKVAVAHLRVRVHLWLVFLWFSKMDITPLLLKPLP